MFIRSIQQNFRGLRDAYEVLICKSCVLLACSGVELHVVSWNYQLYHHSFFFCGMTCSSRLGVVSYS